MLRWLRESAALDNKLHFAFAAMVTPAALAWGVAVRKYSQVSAAARAEPASNYLQVLQYGMETSLAASTGALILMLLVGLVARRRLSRPIEDATAYLEASLESGFDAPPPFRGRLDTAGRIAGAGARLAELRRQATRLQSALDDSTEALGAERRLVLAALADGVGALAASNRRLRGGESQAASPVPPYRTPPLPRPAIEDADLGLVALLQRLQDNRVIGQDHHDLAIPRWQ